MFFSVITKNLNSEILTKMQLLLKDGMGLRLKNFNIVGFTKKSYFQAGGHEKPIYRGELPKKGGGGGLGQFLDIREGGA